MFSLPGKGEQAMAVDLNAIDARIRKLQKLRELLADDTTRELMNDPEIMGFLRDSVSQNGNGGKAHIPIPEEEEDLDLPIEGTLKRTVLDTARACPDKFDINYIVAKMKAANFHFEASDPKVAVNQALRSLTKRRFIRLVRMGSGRIPNIYEAIRGEGVSK
jgi:hypothetical protein